ncbi:hypothetical protein [Polystyrenella longa]|nr:hypothetical protein [Polystyrenella longa]
MLSLMGMVIIGMLIGCGGGVDGSYVITEEQGFLEVAYSGNQPVYLIISDLPQTEVSTPAGSSVLGMASGTSSLTISVEGNDSLSFKTTTTDFKVLTVDSEGHINILTEYDKEPVKQKLVTVINNYNTAPAEDLGDYATDIRRLTGR